ncbi:MAG: MAPEG family protein [Methylocystis sp.]
MSGSSSSALLPGQKTEYAVIMLLLAVGIAGIVALSWRAGAALDPHSLIKPMLAMFAITLVVWVLIPLSRHWAVLTRRASAKYYLDFQKDPPAEWIERPARTYNNLMQAPTLFHVVSLLMIVTPWADHAQLELAWIFVALRAAHALIYLGANHLMLRFASFALSSFVLWAMWARFALIAPYN